MQKPFGTFEKQAPGLSYLEDGQHYPLDKSDGHFYAVDSVICLSNNPGMRSFGVALSLLAGHNYFASFCRLINNHWDSNFQG